MVRKKKKKNKQKKHAVGKLRSLWAKNKLEIKPGVVLFTGSIENLKIPIGIVSQVMSLSNRKFKIKVVSFSTFRDKGGQPYESFVVMKPNFRYFGDKYIVVEDPLFHIDNQNLLNLFSIVEKAKEQGMLPDDYIFGDSF